MIILSIDIGKVCGAVISDKVHYVYSEEIKFNGYKDFSTKMETLINGTGYKPDLILIPYPTRFYRVILFHAKLMGIIEMLADRDAIPVIEVQDSTCKKVVLNNGKATKREVSEFFNEKNEHIADAMLFIAWYNMSIKTKAN